MQNSQEHEILSAIASVEEDLQAVRKSLKEIQFLAEKQRENLRAISAIYITIDQTLRHISLPVSQARDNKDHSQNVLIVSAIGGGQTIMHSNFPIPLRTNFRTIRSSRISTNRIEFELWISGFESC
jgi:CHASE3 domain sensor protein